MGPSGYIHRAVDSEIEALFADLPALMLTGPRAAGKTTTARRHAESIVRLDREAEAEAFKADPDAALRAIPEPVVLDEWQSVPGVLGAVKRAIDDDGFRGGRFLLTGSVRASLTGETWPGTGRIAELRTYGLTERELAGRPTGPSFLARLAESRGDPEAFAPVGEAPDLLGYVERALRGGFPEVALGLPETAGRRWLKSYLDQLLNRDAETLAEPRHASRLRAYFDAVALNTAGLPEHKTLYDAAGIDRKTALAYDRLLESLFVLDTLPAWSSNRLSRLVRGAKRYVVDPSLVAAALGLDPVAVVRDGDLLGRLIETFVVAQLRPEVHLDPSAPRLHHLRDRNGRHEVDLVAELGTSGIVAVEIKAGAAPKPADARHIEWLREALGDRFVAGAVLHTGPRSFGLTEHVAALPISSIWGS